MQAVNLFSWSAGSLFSSHSSGGLNCTTSSRGRFSSSFVVKIDSTSSQNFRMDTSDSRSSNLHRSRARRNDVFNMRPDRSLSRSIVAPYSVMWSPDALFQSTVPGLGTRKISCGGTCKSGTFSRLGWCGLIKNADISLTLINSLYKCGVVDVPCSRVLKLAEEKFKVLRCHVEGQEVEDPAKLGWGHHSCVVKKPGTVRITVLLDEKIHICLVDIRGSWEASMAEEQQTESMGEMQQSDGGSANGGNPQESDDDRKLFVGGLSWETTENDLKEYFEKYGKVASCNLKKDLETMRSRGFGFVVFESAEAVEKNKTIDPKRANPKGRFQDPPIKKIYVAKVDPAVSEEEIKEYFGQWGEVEKVEAPFDKEKEQRRNFVFVEFKNEESVDKVLNHSTENPEFKHSLGSDEFTRDMAMDMSSLLKLRRQLPDSVDEEGEVSSGVEIGGVVAEEAGVDMEDGMTTTVDMAVVVMADTATATEIMEDMVADTVAMEVMMDTVAGEVMISTVDMVVMADTEDTEVAMTTVAGEAMATKLELMDLQVRQQVTGKPPSQCVGPAVATGRTSSFSGAGAIIVLSMCT
ncbi:ROAA-like protein [Mya arenaria]|uniref:ROAA-like protein n=1 Tax=Mya arenaria TaxID=6604 RepID=A0ABY7DE75_MYAAR|nr:ROAA-like protein [Mya arenaria]